MPTPEHLVAVEAVCGDKSADGMRPIRFERTEIQNGTSGAVGSAASDVMTFLQDKGGRAYQSEIITALEPASRAAVIRAIRSLKESGHVAASTTEKANGSPLIYMKARSE